MPTYNFKKQNKLYVVRDGLRYLLDIYPDLSFSQTFNETNVPVKTLHSQFNMFEAAVITVANPANFSFTSPILQEGDMDVLFTLLRDYAAGDEATLNTADLYVESNSEVYKLEKAVFESGTFQIVKDSPLAVSLSGTARKLSKFTGAIPGTLQPRTTRTHTAVTSMQVAVGGVVQPYITAVTVELKNDVQWVDHATLQNSIGISDASGTMFPEAFVVGSRTLSGTIQQYITDETNSNVNTWRTNAPVNIQVTNTGSAWALEFLLPSAVFTNRLEVQDIYIQSYEFRMNSNPVLASVIKKRTI
jgi:hypothetical protein